MLRLIPAPAHRAAMPVGFALRRMWLRVFRPSIAGVAVFITNDAGEILLLRQSYGPQGWTMPAGGAKRAEDPVVSLRREVREELGCEIAEITLLSECEEMMHGAPNHVTIFHARAIDEPAPDRREVVEVRWFALDNLPDAMISATRQRLPLLERIDLQK